MKRDPAFSPFPEIVCPVDGLFLQEGAGALACANGHVYVVECEIPRIVIGGGGYTDAFGEQWNTYRLTQLDSYTGSTISRDRLSRCLGEDLWSELGGSSHWQVLETGCGAGRFTEVLLELPAARVTSTDLSSAVDANARNCPQIPRHRVIQCDINALPFRPGSYDVVICLGVIQHTPSPERTIEALYAQVKPGGWLVIDHYSPSFSHYTKITALLLRPLLKRLPPRMGTRATEILTDLFFPMHRRVKDKRLLQIVLSRISPLLTYFQAYPQLDDRLQYEWALLDTHDSLTDYYKHLRTAPQVERFLEKLGARSIRVARGGNGVEARCRKPG